LKQAAAPYHASSLRTQGPITPGLKSEKRFLPECRSESPRRMGRKSGYLDYDEVIGAGVAGVWKVFDGRRDLAPRLV
jgi:hypothetical protein